MSMRVVTLSPNLVKVHSQEIIESLDQIPLTNPHSLAGLLAMEKPERSFLEKWQHSLIAFDEQDRYIGIAIGYERASEENELYPAHSIYLNDFAIHSDFQQQGFGRKLLLEFLAQNRRVGFLVLTGDVVFSVQTNAAAFNIHVQRLYESVGFKPITQKVYENRVDMVCWLEG